MLIKVRCFQGKTHSSVKNKAPCSVSSLITYRLKQLYGKLKNIGQYARDAASCYEAVSVWRESPTCATFPPTRQKAAVKVGSVLTRSFKTCSKLSLSFPEKERVWGRSRSADTNIFLRGFDWSWFSFIQTNVILNAVTAYIRNQSRPGHSSGHHLNWGNWTFTSIPLYTSGYK